ncbi:MAG TPA: hypothetical protein VKE40_12625 [Gemmataceae bacterium]|nr:hypothetical protein [Gemmataceae bacterium]
MSRLTESWKGGRIVRVNLTFAAESKKYAEQIGVVQTPTFVLFDANGNEQGRWVGHPPEVGELP